MRRRPLLVAMLAALAGCGSSVSREEAKTEPVHERAPEIFKVLFETTKGDILIQAHRPWAPNGADRFYTLVKSGFYDGAHFFRVIYNFVAQFGLKGVPAVDRVWADAVIADDPVLESNGVGTLTFAKSGPNSRTTQVFINLRDNRQLDAQGFAPFGRVTQGMDVVERLYKMYGDAPPNGNGPDQGRIRMQGNEYLDRGFPRLDAIKKATVVN